MAKRARRSTPRRGPRKEAGVQKIATFQINGNGKNEVDPLQEELNPSLSNGDTVAFDNKLKSSVVIVLWGKDQVLKNAGVEIVKGGPRAVFLPAKTKVEFQVTSTAAAGDTCHYKVMVNYS